MLHAACSLLTVLAPLASIKYDGCLCKAIPDAFNKHKVSCLITVWHSVRPPLLPCPPFIQPSGMQPHRSTYRTVHTAILSLFQLFILYYQSII
jgi:hypothetical protein